MVDNVTAVWSVIKENKIIEVFPVKDIAFKLLLILGTTKIRSVDLPHVPGRHATRGTNLEPVGANEIF